MNELTYHIKAREKGTKRWFFVTPKLTLNGKRIFAAEFTREQAETEAAAWATQDERYEFRAQPI